MRREDLKQILTERNVPLNDSDDKEKLICKVIVTDKRKGKMIARVVSEEDASGKIKEIVVSRHKAPGYALRNRK